MRTISKLLILGLVLVLSACSSGGSPNPDPDPDPQPNNELAGKYNGSITFNDWFADIAFTIDNAGTVTGTTTVISPSSPVGEKGTLTGTIKSGSSAATLEFNLVLESAGVGRNTITGAGVYSNVTRQLGSGSITVKDANGTFVDNGIITGTKE